MSKFLPTDEEENFGMNGITIQQQSWLLKFSALEPNLIPEDWGLVKTLDYQGFHLTWE